MKKILLIASTITIILVIGGIWYIHKIQKPQDQLTREYFTAQHTGEREHEAWMLAHSQKDARRMHVQEIPPAGETLPEHASVR